MSDTLPNAHSTLYYVPAQGQPKIEAERKVAAFDLDHTIVQPKADAKGIRPQFMTVDPQTGPQWQYMYTINMINRGNVKLTTSQSKDILVDLLNKGWTVVIFSNQLSPKAKMWNGSLAACDIIGHINSDLHALTGGKGVWAYISQARDGFRKPETGMWKLFLQHCGWESTLKPAIPLAPSDPANLLLSNVEPCSFYCGDASSKSDIDPRYRWHNSDREFAQKCGLSFLTPSQVFCRLPAQLEKYRVIICSGGVGSGCEADADIIKAQVGETAFYFGKDISVDVVKAAIAQKTKPVIIAAPNLTPNHRYAFYQSLGLVAQDRLPDGVLFVFYSRPATEPTGHDLPSEVGKLIQNEAAMFGN